MKHSVDIHMAERRLERWSRTLAEQEAKVVAPDRLTRAISEYVQWRAFSYWVRLIVDSEGGVTETMHALLDRKCPGFLAYAANYQQRNPREREFLWLRLIEWIDNEIFRFAAEGGWSHALGFYAARDPGLDQVRKYWAECDDTWKARPPAAAPTYEEWRRIASLPG
jgi:hypothetical protein